MAIKMCQLLPTRPLLLVAIIISIVPPQCSSFLSSSGSNNVSPSNILILVGLGSHSHRTAMEPLAHKLVAHGHNVTFLTPIKPTVPNPKFNEFSPPQLTNFYQNVIEVAGDQFFPDRLANKYQNAVPSPVGLDAFEQASCNLLFRSPEFKPWLEEYSSRKVDLMILDHPLNRCGFAIAHKLKAAVILFQTAGMINHEHDTFAFPVENSWLPHPTVKNVFTRERTLYDKIYVTAYLLYYYYYSYWIALPRLDSLVREVLEMPDLPSIQEMERDASLMLVNQHFSNDYARSLPPFVVEVGGMHCTNLNNNTNKGTLTKEMQNFIDGAGDHGFIFVSFGTIISMSKVSPDLVKHLMDTVSKTKTRFFWKWDGEIPKDLPSNVMAGNWFPQQALLASPKIRAFVTHGGLMSVQQAVCHGVPMIVVPVIYDQPYNAQTVAFHEIGIHIELSEMKETFAGALDAILNDKKYALNAKRIGGHFKDRPLSPVDTAYFWTEYVLRHKNDMGVFKSTLAMEQTWWQRRLLDMWAVILGLLLATFFIIWKVLRFVLALVVPSSKRKRD